MKKNKYKAQETQLQNMQAEISDMSHLSDDDVRDLFTVLLNFCKSPLEYKAIVDHVMFHLDDKEWVRNIYKTAIDNLAEVDYYIFADSILYHLKDKEWARELYERDLANELSMIDFCFIIESIANNLEDEKWAKKIFDDLISKTSTTEEYFELVNIAHSTFGDIVKSKELLFLGESISKTSNDYLKIAIQVENILKDLQRKEALLHHAFDLAKTTEDYCNIAEYTFNRDSSGKIIIPDDIRFYENCMVRAYVLIEHDHDRCLIINTLSIFYMEKLMSRPTVIYHGDNEKSCISLFEVPPDRFMKQPSIFFQDRSWGTILLGKADKSIPFSEDDSELYRTLAKVIYDYFGNKCWRKLKRLAKG